MNNLALTPKQRAEFLSQTERKRKNNEKRLVEIMENPTDNEAFLASLFETAVIVANNKTSSNDQIIKEVKELFDADRIGWLLDKLRVEVCTTEHDDY